MVDYHEPTTIIFDIDPKISTMLMSCYPIPQAGTVWPVGNHHFDDHRVVIGVLVVPERRGMLRRRKTLSLQVVHCSQVDPSVFGFFGCPWQTMGMGQLRRYVGWCWTGLENPGPRSKAKKAIFVAFFVTLDWQDHQIQKIRPLLL